MLEVQGLEPWPGWMISPRAHHATPDIGWTWRESNPLMQTLPYVAATVRAQAHQINVKAPLAG